MRFFPAKTPANLSMGDPDQSLSDFLAEIHDLGLTCIYVGRGIQEMAFSQGM